MGAFLRPSTPDCPALDFWSSWQLSIPRRPSICLGPRNLCTFKPAKELLPEMPELRGDRTDDHLIQLLIPVGSCLGSHRRLVASGLSTSMLSPPTGTGVRKCHPL